MECLVSSWLQGTRNCRRHSRQTDESPGCKIFDIYRIQFAESDWLTTRAITRSFTTGAGSCLNHSTSSLSRQSGQLGSAFKSMTGASHQTRKPFCIVSRMALEGDQVIATLRAMASLTLKQWGTKIWEGRMSGKACQRSHDNAGRNLAASLIRFQFLT